MNTFDTRKLRSDAAKIVLRYFDGNYDQAIEYCTRYRDRGGELTNQWQAAIDELVAAKQHHQEVFPWRSKSLKLTQK